jgi:hypothetical protein
MVELICERTGPSSLGPFLSPPRGFCVPFESRVQWLVSRTDLSRYRADAWRRAAIVAADRCLFSRTLGGAAGLGGSQRASSPVVLGCLEVYTVLSLFLVVVERD